MGFTLNASVSDKSFTFYADQTQSVDILSIWTADVVGTIDVTSQSIIRLFV